LRGWRVALFAFVSLAYLGLFGFWEKSMSTMALVITAVSICLLFGLPLGIWCAMVIDRVLQGAHGRDGARRNLER
jgi:glycine betaine/proline transport system permease protein